MHTFYNNASTPAVTNCLAYIVLEEKKHEILTFVGMKLIKKKNDVSHKISAVFVTVVSF